MTNPRMESGMEPVSAGSTKISRMLTTIAQRQATGSLVLAQGKARWRLIFLRGQLLWAIDQQFRVRRWQRALKRTSISFAPTEMRPANLPLWEVWWLAAGVAAGQMTSEVARSIIGAVAQEVLLVASADSSVSCQWDKYVPALPEAIAASQQMLDSDQLAEVMKEAIKLLQRWESVGLSPNLADRAPQLDQVGWSPSAITQKESSTFLTLAPLLNGQRSTWDLALLMRQPLPIMVHILHHLYRQGNLKFLTLGDWPQEAFLQASVKSALAAASAPASLPIAPISLSQANQPAGITGVTQPIPTAIGDSNRALSALPQNFVGLNQALAAELSPSLSSASPSTSPSTSPSLSSASSPSESSATAPKTRPPLVLLIDDDPMVGRLLKPLVHRLGCRFFHVMDATRALAVAIEQRPDLILLDLVMPIANGYEICAQLRRVKTLAHIPIAIVTSNHGAIDRVRAKFSGASAFVAKPLRSDRIAPLIQKYLTLDSPPKSPSSLSDRSRPTPTETHHKT
ncbi:MAG: response regulator [Oscillatoriales cyanobacterium]|nr:MAG: response regulator [Oscillatoriales cyanobacterium]